jgi:gluconokinase
VVFVHLDGSAEQIGARLSKRLDHFMPASMLESQLATLEPLQSDEAGLVVPLGRTSVEEVADIISRLDLHPR